MEYKGNLVMITKDNNPMWCEQCPAKLSSTYYDWKMYSMNVKAIIICAVTYLDDVYLLSEFKFNSSNIMVL